MSSKGQIEYYNQATINGNPPPPPKNKKRKSFRHLKQTHGSVKSKPTRRYQWVVKPIVPSKHKSVYEDNKPKAPIQPKPHHTLRRYPSNGKSGKFHLDFDGIHAPGTQGTTIQSTRRSKLKSLDSKYVTPLTSRAHKTKSIYSNEPLTSRRKSRSKRRKSTASKASSKSSRGLSRESSRASTASRDSATGMLLSVPEINRKKSLSPLEEKMVEATPDPFPSDKIYFHEPLTAAQALKHYMKRLTSYEQREIFDFPKIYCMGRYKSKIHGSVHSSHNLGYDDDNGDYRIRLKDHIGYRYEIVEPLGKGSFGQVVKVYDVKTKRFLALKMIRNRARFHQQARIEVSLLHHLKTNDPDEKYHIINMVDYFHFRDHLCITFELLSINLYEFIKNNNFKGLSLGLIRRFAVQMLQSLSYLYKERIIHCDLKPENVLLKSPTKSGIKVIDFGSSCFSNSRIYTYIQSRFYRAPEIILGIPYTCAIDIWSFGCILAELYTGYPLFPGENEAEQLACIMEIFDLPPAALMDKATRKKHFFSHGQPRVLTNSKGIKHVPGSKSLFSALKCDDELFLSFLKACLTWDPSIRITPGEAIRHPWIQEGLIHMSGGQSNLRRRRASYGTGSTPHRSHFQQTSKSHKRHSTITIKKKQNHTNHLPILENAFKSPSSNKVKSKKRSLFKGYP
mmetsp:Transcript_7822/g.11606  ORF Transcript_7822/g.11606 Transcript_7822/m.11606 type:complete len:677 (-) Transcript_7822:30-2060(-)